MATDPNHRGIMVDDLITGRRPLGRVAELDENGNLAAQVTPRSDTLANLLLVTDAGEGEIASATDVDAIVKYLGTPSVGKAYYMSKMVGAFIVPVSAVSPLTATATTLPFSFPTTDTIGVVDDANATITIPASGVTGLDLALSITWPAGAGTYREIFIEYDVTGGGVWVPFLSQDFYAANIASLFTKQNEAAYMIPVTSYLGKKLRIRIKHDAGSTLSNVTGLISGNFYNYA